MEIPGIINLNNSHLVQVVIALALVTSIYLPTSAQNICGNNFVAEKQAALLNRFLDTSRTQKPISPPPIPRSSTIYIPVVIHLIYRTEAQNLSSTLIYRQIDILNKMFSKNRTIDVSELPGWEYQMGSPNIRFCLADIKPGGQPTDGIIRTQTDIKDIGTRFEDQFRIAVYYNQYGGQDAWAPDRYLNIWICEMGNSIIGRATIPGELNYPKEEGVVVNLANVSDQASSTLGYTMVHEVGHYLGLYHPWGRDGSCASTDYVADTPPQDAPVYNCVTSQSCGSPDMYFNFMAYTPDICMSLFTAGQVKRMRDIIPAYHPYFVNSDTKCNTQAVPDEKQLRTRVENNSIVLECVAENTLLKGTLKLYNIKGNLISSEILYGNVVGIINAINLPPGIYILSFISDDGNIKYTSKLFYGAR